MKVSIKDHPFPYHVTNGTNFNRMALFCSDEIHGAWLKHELCEDFSDYMKSKPNPLYF